MDHKTSCGCFKEIGSSRAHIPHYCDHGQLFIYTKPLKRSALKHQSEKTQAGGRLRRSLKAGRGFSASPAQQAKVKGLPCIVCGRDEYEEVRIEAAHVYPRRLQSCECADGVVPMCHADHRRYDDQNERFDLQPYLVNREYHAELVHAVAVHGASLSELLYQVTGDRYVPAEERAAA